MKCPRCNMEQPDTRECKYCGQLISEIPHPMTARVGIPTSYFLIKSLKIIPLLIIIGMFALLFVKCSAYRAHQRELAYNINLRQNFENMKTRLNNAYALRKLPPDVEVIKETLKEDLKQGFSIQEYTTINNGYGYQIIILDERTGQRHELKKQYASLSAP